MESEADDDCKNVETIALEYEDAYESVNVSSPQSLSSGAIKGKYYKQTYRQAWENMPDFKGNKIKFCFEKSPFLVFRLVARSRR